MRVLRGVVYRMNSKGPRTEPCNISLANCFYARKQNASRVLAIVLASVCPSVTLVICIKTVQARITKSSLGLPQGL